MPEQSQHKPHDNSYKLLFSNPQMVADLLRGYIHQHWVEQLDFTTLSRGASSHVSADLREREDDIIWRVRWADQQRWLYIYLLLQFQSRPDRYMALRILTYLGRLYEDLGKTRQLTPSGKLPPVLPIVLYNGRRRWHAAQDIAELIDKAPGDLQTYRPHLRYFLLDENRYANEPIPQVRNLVAALFGLENSRTPEDIRQLLSLLIDWLALPEQMQLRRHFTVWIKRVLLPARMGAINTEHLEQLDDLQEVDSMLAERVKDWTRDWQAQGIEEGHEKGHKEAAAAVLLRLLERHFGPLEEACAATNPAGRQRRTGAPGRQDSRCRNPGRGLRRAGLSRRGLAREGSSAWHNGFASKETPASGE
ncbi:Rpn family recombination-promoting nuclease/putative transposase [Stutzerimonas kirkiae]|uniref:Rpn family recombination-promoting nuclease/putative transposase n=1 Tax=Stutzerimonas kirkiae TaxID=2211392 RepID=UPI001A956068|nr:Rpn family recombination-promoting nuclease/putative transposase [Stutzerimonas kirkiae]